MKFEDLEEEKKERILNAGIEQFAKHGFKHANTEEIARKAGISKGLLFYYFKNKQSFYVYLLDYCENIVATYITPDEVNEIDDFFELLKFGAQHKITLLKHHPHCMEFIMQVWFSLQESDVEPVKHRITTILNSTYQTYFQHLDYSRFKEGMDPMRIYQMLMWMMEGYLYDLRLMKKPLDVEEMMEEFYKWEAMFKQLAYKEEFL